MTEVVARADRVRVVDLLEELPLAGHVAEDVRGTGPAGATAGGTNDRPRPVDVNRPSEQGEVDVVAARDLARRQRNEHVEDLHGAGIDAARVVVLGGAGRQHAVLAEVEAGAHAGRAVAPLPLVELARDPAVAVVEAEDLDRAGVVETTRERRDGDHAVLDARRQAVVVTAAGHRGDELVAGAPCDTRPLEHVRRAGGGPARAVEQRADDREITVDVDAAAEVVAGQFVARRLAQRLLDADRRR